MLKNKIILIGIILILPFDAVFAEELDNIKAEFLRSHYQNVIAEGQAKGGKVKPSNVDELNYLVGLSLLKENRGREARSYFSQVLASHSDKFKERAKLALEATRADNSGSGEYSVQVGFFTSITNATNLKDKLLARNYPAYLENAGSGYRVKVGHLKTSNEALILGNKLSHEGFQTKICP